MTYRRETYPVDILVRGYENAALTHACLSSIVANTDPALYQLTYVDNGTNEDSFMHLVRSFPGAQFARLPFNHGSVRAINTGLLLALQSPSDFVLLLDNDTEIPAGDVEWLDRFISYFEDSEVAAAGAVTDYVAGMQQAEHAPDTYTRDWEEDGRGGVKRPPDSPVRPAPIWWLRSHRASRWSSGCAFSTAAVERPTRRCSRGTSRWPRAAC